MAERVGHTPTSESKLLRTGIECDVNLTSPYVLHGLSSRGYVIKQPYSICNACMHSSIAPSQGLLA